ncbi:MAG TPA: hypothetical protein VED00_01830 [archaeon]|nr:hypothetical protein [archaeon]
MTTLLAIYNDDSMKITKIPDGESRILLRCLNKKIYSIDIINNGSDDVYVSTKTYVNENVEVLIKNKKFQLKKVKEIIVNATDASNLDFFTNDNMKEITIKWKQK